MNKSIFETKEQYLAFRAAFAAAQNDRRAKPTFVEVPCSVYDWRIRETRSWMGKEKHSGWLNAEHFILLNAIRRKPLNRGFSPAVKQTKIHAYNKNPNLMYDRAFDRLFYAQVDAKKLLEGVETTLSAFEQRMSADDQKAYLAKKKADTIDRLTRSTNRILEPFNGTLTLVQFAALDLGE